MYYAESIPPQYRGWNKPNVKIRAIKDKGHKCSINAWVSLKKNLYHLQKIFKATRNHERQILIFLTAQGETENDLTTVISSVELALAIHNFMSHYCPNPYKK